MKNSSYTPAQASAVTKLPLKTVHKLIDERLVRPHRQRVGREVRRLLSQEQLIYLKLEAEGLRLLPLAARREVAKTIEASPHVDFVMLSGGRAIVIEVKAARHEVSQELERLRKAQQMIVSDPEVMQGTPVFRGTRIPIDLAVDMMDRGATVEEILEGYPALDREKIGLAQIFMRAFPRRGRPSRRPWAKQKPIRIARQRRSLAG
ncbi:MAG TPA: DUF433 domain-containing protein [Candidatus Angelobacter sp.]|nr:DUF433 domain-containing protein [Candidatus Angelobacter sp.]